MPVNLANDNYRINMDIEGSRGRYIIFLLKNRYEIVTGGQVFNS